MMPPPEVPEVPVAAQSSLASLANPRGELRTGMIVAGLFFVVFLGWAVFARLDSAAYGVGSLTVSGQRQAVQHRDGGVVGEIFVHEGQRVVKGQLLLRIAAPEVVAQERALTSEAIRMFALRARLEAEQAGTAIAVPVEFAMLSDSDRAEGMRALTRQAQERSARAAELSAQSGALGQRTGQAGAQREGYVAQMASTDEQIRLLDDQIAVYKPVADKGFISQTRMRELDRARAALVGQRDQYRALGTASVGAGRQSQLEQVATTQGFREKVGQELRETDTQIGQVVPKFAAAREQLARTEVRSPATGTVVGLSIFTPGGVIAAGQKLMDVVPDNTPLVIDAKFSPRDASDLRVGQTAELRFNSIHDRSLKPLTGKLTRFSADVFVDEKTGAQYYSGEVTIPHQAIANLLATHPQLQLRAGLPVDVLVTLQPRSALDYMVGPLFDQFWSSGHER